MDRTPERVYRASAEMAWEDGGKKLFSHLDVEAYVELMLSRPDWRVLVDVAYRAGQEDTARGALVVRGEADITTVVAALDLMACESVSAAERAAAGDLLHRLPTWMGSDGAYVPRMPGVPGAGTGGAQA